MTWLEDLARLPGAFDFHAVLRRIDVSSDAPPLGEGERPSEEWVRVGQLPSSAFESSELTAFTPSSETSKASLTVGFLGLWGPHGPLPAHVTEYAYERLKHVGDATLVRFADVFHHRALLLFHRVWARTQPTVAMDRPARDSFAYRIGALMGIGLDAARNRDRTHDYTKLHYAALLAASPRNADGLRDLLRDYFGLPVAIEEFVGEWLDLPDDERWRLGRSKETGSFGRIALGRRVWSCSHKFRVVLGPLPPADFDRMLPGSSVVDTLVSLIRLYTNDEWSWELRLTLDRQAGAPMRLGSGARLGWTTRIGTGSGVVADLVVDPQSRKTHRVLRRTSVISSSSERN